MVGMLGMMSMMGMMGMTAGAETVGSPENMGGFVAGETMRLMVGRLAAAMAPVAAMVAVARPPEESASTEVVA